jgi:hypothetical protein
MRLKGASIRGAGSGDILIAVAVVACLGIGASLTFMLTRGKPETAAAPAAPVIKGKPLVNYGGKVDPPAGTAPASTPTPTESADGEYLALGFETLSSFFYMAPSMENALKPDRKKDVQIPSPVKSLSGKKVTIRGYMTPTNGDPTQGVTQFMLVKDQSMCCFGRWPRLNEFVMVSMPQGKKTQWVQDQPVTAIGTLQVGEDIIKGVVLSIYRMEAEDVAGPLDL